MVRTIRLKPADAQTPSPIHVNIEMIVSLSPSPEGGSVLELATGRFVLVKDSAVDILKELHSQSG